MLARFEAHDAVGASFLSSDGERLLLQGAPGADRAKVLAGCNVVLAQSNLRPLARPDAEAKHAWAERDDVSRWLSREELWRLSWREAETFADRLGLELERRLGERARELRATLVESFFEAVRPRDGSGPAPHRWKRGATYEERIEAVLDAAQTIFERVEVAWLRKLLEDQRTIRRITRRPSAKPEARMTPNTPWKLSFHDGSGNGTRLWQDGPGAARFEYAPVTPERSSSGTYSGGEPAGGEVQSADVEALWKEAERLAADASLHVEGRAMGTARLRLKTPAGQRSVLLRRGSFDALGGLLRRLRGE